MIGRKELKALTGVARPGAILSYGTAEVNPVKLTAGLWRAAIARGVKVYAPVEVDDVASFRDHVRVKLKGAARSAPAPSSSRPAMNW